MSYNSANRSLSPDERRQVVLALLHHVLGKTQGEELWPRVQSLCNRT
jgi:hypothetical protein